MSVLVFLLIWGGLRYLYRSREKRAAKRAQLFAGFMRKVWR